MTAIVLFAKG